MHFKCTGQITVILSVALKYRQEIWSRIRALWYEHLIYPTFSSSFPILFEIYSQLTLSCKHTNNLMIVTVATNISSFGIIDNTYNTADALIILLTVYIHILYFFKCLYSFRLPTRKIFNCVIVASEKMRMSDTSFENIHQKEKVGSAKGTWIDRGKGEATTGHYSLCTHPAQPPRNHNSPRISWITSLSW